MKRQWFYELELEDGLLPPASFHVGDFHARVYDQDGKLSGTETITNGPVLYRYGNRIDEEAAARFAGERVGERIVEAIRDTAMDFIRRVGRE